MAATRIVEAVDILEYRTIRSDVLIEQIGRDIGPMVAIGCGPIFRCPDDLDAVLAHQAAHTPATEVSPNYCSSSVISGRP